VDKEDGICMLILTKASNRSDIKYALVIGYPDFFKQDYWHIFNIIFYKNMPTAKTCHDLCVKETIKYGALVTFNHKLVLDKEVDNLKLKILSKKF
jgi:hypothetical protein